LAYSFDRLCFQLGWGLFWSMHGTSYWTHHVREEEKAFGERCTRYYCVCIELQQTSVLAFLSCWNKRVGVKDVGVMIGKMVWSAREDCLMKPFLEETQTLDPVAKRIKK
jgi:hypothetical protein